MTTKTNEEIVEELYIEHLESLMQEADMAVRYEVKDKEKYYERLRIGSRELLDAIRNILTQKDKETALAVEKERERIWEKLQGHTIREHRSNMTDWIDWNDVCAVFGKETELEKRIKEKEEELAKLKSLTPQ